MGIIKSKFRKMEEFDCSMDDVDGQLEHQSEDPRSPTSTISRTPLPTHDTRAKASLITRATNLANISTPINNDLLMIQDKRFKHLAYSFIDPRSPSEGIVRTPIVIKSSDISSIVNTPRILEDELEREEGEEEDFQKTFVERLSKLSFDDCLDEETEENVQQVKLPEIMETNFDYLGDEEKEQAAAVEPLKPRALVNAQSVVDPRSPTIGIVRTPLVFGEKPSQRGNEITINPSTFAEQLKEGPKEEQEDENETKEDEKQDKETKTIEGAVAITVKAPQEEPIPSAIVTDVPRAIYGTPVQITGSVMVRTPLSCLANRKRGEINANGKSPMVSNIPIKSNRKPKLQPQQQQGAVALKVTNSANTNPFENTTPRKMIR